jgi:ADP-heptose:LPS heptosyltransferase
VSHFKQQLLLLKNQQSPGDILMLTAGVRDLHRAYPNQYLTDVDTSAPELWENNPNITKLKPEDPNIQVLDCRYPLINQSNTTPHHFIHGFAQFLENKLNIKIPITQFKGDIYLSHEEKSWISQVEELGYKGHYWVIVAGGKSDYTCKWWDIYRYQEVVDYFKNRIQFVQSGDQDHWHLPLNHVIDLRGKTDLRQFVRLIHHADGVLCPVTLAMHLAAAVETKPNKPKNRACVVIAGGREPSQWEAYPHHQYIHTCGALSCCDQGGCWKSRCQLIGDGDPKDKHLCLQPVQLYPSLRIPKCMDMISSEMVIRRIELYYEGGALKYEQPRATGR